MARTFLLSPARCDGERAKLILNGQAEFPLARALREPEGVAIGEVFSFLSGLYFRGKLAYARAFGRAGVLVITTERGLVSPETRVTARDLCAFAEVDIAGGDERYLGPLRRDVDALTRALGERDEVVGPRIEHRLMAEGAEGPGRVRSRGRRGGAAPLREGRELEYIPVAGAVRHGVRPPKLTPLR